MGYGVFALIQKQEIQVSKSYGTLAKNVKLDL